jgi:chemotaxis protein methyltransferase CheR
MNMQSLPVAELSLFKRQFHQLSGYNLENYKNVQMDRRLFEYMQAANCENLQSFFDYLRNRPEEVRRFLDDLSINTSEFFRNPERFQELRQKIMPEILSKRNRLRIWSAGCSVGAEIFSLVILMEHLGLSEHCHFIASDIDREALEQARSGIFFPELLNHVNKTEITTFFEPCTENKRSDAYKFKDKWRQRVHFIHHDLLKDEYPGNFDLIICRNVMIYFTREAKNRVYQQFFSSLREGGVLFVGGAEQLMQAQDLGYKSLSSYFYQKQKLVRS